MRDIVRWPGGQLRIAVKIGSLGAIGIVGMLTIAAIYNVGRQIEQPMEREAVSLAWTYQRFAEMDMRLAEVRQSQSDLLLRPGEVKAAQHLTALDLLESDYAKTLVRPEFSERAHNSVQALLEATAIYVNISRGMVIAQRAFGLSSDGGARGDLKLAVARFGRAVAAAPSLSRVATDIWHIITLTYADALPGPDLVTDVMAQAMAAAPTNQLTATSDDLVAHVLPDLETALLHYVSTAQTLRNLSADSERAFEEAEMASTAALGVTSQTSAFERRRLEALRQQITRLMYIGTAAVGLIVALFAFLIGRGISNPLSRVALVTNELAAGNLDAQILYAERSDEIGDVARALKVFRNSIHQKRLADEKIYQLAHHDTLTGLANRVSLHGRLLADIELSCRETDSVAVLCLDLDGFKSINDLYGHEAGDTLLCEAARRLTAETRQEDFVARIGGDEFVIVQVQAGQPEAVQALAQRLIAALASPYDLGEGVRGSVTVSIGIALCPSHGTDSAELLRNADTALYRAKWAGKCCSTFFEAEMDREIRDRRSLEADLKLAIERKELFLEWQPLATTGRTSVINGFEVLLRWQHPLRGLVAPSVFIPLAEACGAINEIGLWVLRQACDEAVTWSSQHSIAVNVSPIQAQQGDAFARAVEMILSETKLDPHRLELEVTESVFINDPERVLHALGRLKRLGVRFALDDFGTGYSSLATLRAFPFDKIKIDQRFTLGVSSNEEDGAILRAVIGLARGLKLPVVAEGVESSQQLDALVAEGCEQVQGWLIGRPAAIHHFRRLVKEVEPQAA